MYVSIHEVEEQFYISVNKLFYRTCNMNNDYRVNRNSTIFYTPLKNLNNKYYDSLKLLFPPDSSESFNINETSIPFIGLEYYHKLKNISSEEDLKKNLYLLHAEYLELENVLTTLSTEYTKYPYLTDTTNFVENILIFTAIQRRRFASWFDKYVDKYYVSKLSNVKCGNAPCKK